MRVILSAGFGSQFRYFLQFLIYLRFGWINFEKIGDQIADFLMLELILIKFCIDMTLKIFGRLWKQVLKSEFFRHFGYFSH